MHYLPNPDGSPALAEPLTITCRVCARALPLEKMVRHKRRRYGRDTICLECQCVAARERRAARRAAGMCQYSTGCPSPAVPGRGGYCAEHAADLAARKAADRAADPEKARAAQREFLRAFRARLAARTAAEVAADLARVLAESPDGLLPCRAGHRAPAEEFSANRTRRSGRDNYCREHAAERNARHRSEARARLLSRWAEVDLYRCYLTGVDFEDDGPHALHVDHQWSLARGGPDVEENLFPASAAANLRKSARPFAEVLEEYHPGVLAAVADWPTIVIDLDTGEVTGAEDAVEFLGGLL